MIEKNNAFTGVIPAVITLLNEKKEVSMENTEQFFSWIDNKGFSAQVILGSTGEGVMLNKAERQKVLECAKSAITKSKIITGISASNSKEAVEDAKIAKSKGAEGLLVSPPYYIKPTQKQIIEYVDTIIKAVDLPIMLYNIPARTASGMSIETIGYLFKEYQNTIIGIKDGSGSLAMLSELLSIKRTSGKSYFSADDGSCYATTLAGGDGVVSVLANVFPKTFGQWHMACVSQNSAQVYEIKQKLDPYLQLLQKKVGCCVVKVLRHIILGEKIELSSPLTIEEDEVFMQSVAELIAEDRDLLIKHEYGG